MVPEQSAGISQPTRHCVQGVEYLTPETDEIAVSMIRINLKNGRSKFFSDRAIRPFA